MAKNPTHEIEIIYDKVRRYVRVHLDNKTGEAHRIEDGVHVALVVRGSWNLSMKPLEIPLGIEVYTNVKPLVRCRDCLYKELIPLGDACPECGNPAEKKGS
jgi:hypothetical protein